MCIDRSCIGWVALVQVLNLKPKKNKSCSEMALFEKKTNFF